MNEHEEELKYLIDEKKRIRAEINACKEIDKAVSITINYLEHGLYKTAEIWDLYG